MASTAYCQQGKHLHKQTLLPIAKLRGQTHTEALQKLVEHVSYQCLRCQEAYRKRRKSS